MSPKGPHLQTLLLLFVMTTFLLSWSEGSAFQDFLRLHQDMPKSNFANDKTYCNEMMRRRGLKCQRGNTFIHANDGQLTSICNSRGRILNGSQTSKTLFPITICTLRRGFKGVACKYKGKSKIKMIRVTCEKGLPIHFITAV